MLRELISKLPYSRNQLTIIKYVYTYVYPCYGNLVQVPKKQPRFWGGRGSTVPAMEFGDLVLEELGVGIHIADAE